MKSEQPMNLPIQGRYEESAEHLADAAKQMPSPRGIALIYFFTAFASVSMARVDYLAKQQSWFIPLFLFPIFCLVMIQMNSKRSLKKKYFSVTGRDSTMVVCEFDEVGFRTQTDIGVKIEFSWSAIEKCVERNSGILIYAPNKQVHWIPKRAFESQSDFARVVALAKMKVSDFTPFQA